MSCRVRRAGPTGRQRLIGADRIRLLLGRLSAPVVAGHGSDGAAEAETAMSRHGATRCGDDKSSARLGLERIDQRA